jgi:hypothetical protein
MLLIDEDRHMKVVGLLVIAIVLISCGKSDNKNTVSNSVKPTVPVAIAEGVSQHDKNGSYAFVE